ncbi:MAG: hypothetical protein LBU70_10780, partial [Chitinispirillales bacterium]|nr:hypothetical protein [Chitinispirillales bacterium]
MSKLVGNIKQLFFGVVMIGAFSLAFGDSGSFTDPRDGQAYRTVRIGTQTWMAENLNFNVSGSWCYKNTSGNCNRFGRLYDWATVMGFSSSFNSTSCASQVQSRHRGICPVGWHVPSDAEWSTLVNFVGSPAGTRLKAASPFWNGTDNHGFSALPGGYRWGGSFYGVGTLGYWW